MSCEVKNQPDSPIIKDERKNDDICEFLRSKCLSDKLMGEIFTCGLTDEITRKLELLGFTCDEIVRVEKALAAAEDDKDKGSSDFCDCTTPSETTIKSASREHSNYLKEQFGTILPLALRELAMMKPYDPVEYLGHWLLHYKECEDREKRRKEFEEELEEERLKWQQETVTVYIPSDGGESEGEGEGECGLEN